MSNSFAILEFRCRWNETELIEVKQRRLQLRHDISFTLRVIYVTRIGNETVSSVGYSKRKEAIF